MKWFEIVEELSKEKAVTCGEGCISVVLDMFIGDIPIYKFKVQYFREEDELGFLYTEYASTLEELEDIVNREPAFTKCNCCGELIVGNSFEDMETKELTCSIECFQKNREKHMRAEETCECCKGCMIDEGCPYHSEEGAGPCFEDEDPLAKKEFSEFTPEEMDSIGGFTGSDFIPSADDFDGFDVAEDAADELETDDGDYSDEE